MSETSFTTRDRVLEYLAAGGAGSVSEIADTLHLTRSTVYMVCRDLRGAGQAIRRETLRADTRTIEHAYAIADAPQGVSMVERAIAAQPALCCVWRLVVRPA